MEYSLQNFDYISKGGFIDSEDKAIAFCIDIGLIPKDQGLRTCPKQGCDGNLVVKKSNEHLGHVWICNNYLYRNGRFGCQAHFGATKGTFFEHSKVPYRDILYMIFEFIHGSKITNVITDLNEWRANRREKKISSETIDRYFSRCRKVMEIVASHSHKLLGGEGKTISLDETFLRKRKYHRGRYTESMAVTVFGIYCREDKEGVFFEVEGKSKKDLWPLVARNCDPKTATVCTDSAKQ